MSVTYTAVLDVSEDSVSLLSALLHAERVRWGTRKGTRLTWGTYKQAVLVLRWFLEDARMSGLARDNAIGLSTAYAYREEGIAVLAARLGRIKRTVVPGELRPLFLSSSSGAAPYSRGGADELVAPTLERNFDLYESDGDGMICRARG